MLVKHIIKHIFALQKYSLILRSYFSYKPVRLERGSRTDDNQENPRGSGRGSMKGVQKEGPRFVPTQLTVHVSIVHSWYFSLLQTRFEKYLKEMK